MLVNSASMVGTATCRSLTDQASRSKRGPLAHSTAEVPVSPTFTREEILDGERCL